MYTTERVSKWTIAILEDGVKIETAKSLKKANLRVIELTEAKSDDYFLNLKRLETKEVVKPKTEEPVKTEEPKELVKKDAKKGVTIKDRTIECMSSGMTNLEIIDVIQGEFPKSAYKMSHVSWYRSRLVRDGSISEEYSARNMRVKLKNA